MTRPTARCFGVAATLFLVPAAVLPVSAAQINYGTHAGTTVTYVNITEDSGASEPVPLFGAPNVTGNSIDFNPVGFDAFSSGGGVDLTSSNLVFQVAADLGYAIETISFDEAGSVLMGGNVTPGSMGTSTAVFLNGVLDIHEVDFLGINHISVPFAMSFTPSGGTYFLGTDGGGGPIFSTQWTGSVTLPVEQILVANGVSFTGGATRVSLDLSNDLAAISEVGTSALIQKKDLGGVSIDVQTVRVQQVPEPSSLMLSALGALGLAVRRRSRYAR